MYKLDVNKYEIKADKKAAKVAKKYNIIWREIERHKVRKSNLFCGVYNWSGWDSDCGEYCNGWGHKVVIFTTFRAQPITHHVRYINRTWEQYDFQSAIKQAMEKVIKAAAKEYKGAERKEIEENAHIIASYAENKRYNELFRRWKIKDTARRKRCAIG